MRRETAKRTKLCAGTRKFRVPQAPEGDEASGLHAPKRGRALLPLTAAALPTRWDPPGRRPERERRRKPGGRRLACTEDGWNQCACQLPPLPSLAFSPCVLVITRDGLPLFVLSLSAFSLFLSMPPLPLLTSPRSCCFVSLFGHSGSPGCDVCTHLPHMAMPTTPIHLVCAHALDSSLCLTCFSKCLLDRICWPCLVTSPQNWSSS